jgi:branched-subunit amino acid transport protein|tara:strand:- start:316 stop:630 length:315 start_codon:yes stop_codon:yes gene_type:complete
MIWFMMVVTGIFTFGTRFIMLNKVASKKLPAWLVEALNFVPIAVLTAIIVPAVLIDPTSQSLSIIGNPRLLAALIAIAVALVTRQVITTIGAGLATLWVLKWLA